MSRPIFLKYGSFEQLQIKTLEDLERLDTLDEARWTATSVPCDQLVADPVLLSFLDTDKNGRIRVQELKEARRWLWAHLAGRDRVLEGSDTLVLADLAPSHEDTPHLRNLAELLLGLLEAAARDRMTLAQLRTFKADYMARHPNGDGVVTEAQVKDERVRALVAEVLACTGGATDLGGLPGVRATDLDLFLERVTAYVAWCRREKDEAATLFPLGAATADGCAAVVALAPKMAQFFAQCALVALEEGAEARLQATPEQLAALDVHDPGAIQRWMEHAPLARPNAASVLNLEGALNPAYSAALRALATDIGRRVLGEEAPLESLDVARWSAIQAAFIPFVTWRDGRPVGIPDGADPEVLGAWLGSPQVEALRRLAAEDERVADDLQAFQTMERLLLYQRWMLTIVNNIVSMPELFEPGQRALFQRGTLILDARRFDLCVKVDDLAAHKKMAATSLIFLVYFRTFRKEPDRERSELLAAAVTSDVRGGIGIDKRGVFYDRDGLEWDAIVVDLIVHPISMREAMISPFLRIRDSIADRLTKSLESAAGSAEESASSAALATTDAAKARAQGAVQAGATASAAPVVAASKPAPAPAAPAGGGFQTLLVGGSVAIAAIGSASAFIISTVSQIDPLNALSSLISMLGVLLALFGLLAWLKLRRRDVSALLEACGWALNSRMRLVFPLAYLFTKRPGVSPGAKIVHRVSTRRVNWYVVGLVILLGAGGYYVVTHMTLPEPPPTPLPIPEIAPAN